MIMVRVNLQKQDIFAKFGNPKKTLREKKKINLPKIVVKYNARENYHMMMVMVEQDRLMEYM